MTIWSRVYQSEWVAYHNHVNFTKFLVPLSLYFESYIKKTTKRLKELKDIHYLEDKRKTKMIGKEDF
jgi:hypothetical protein